MPGEFPRDQGQQRRASWGTGLSHPCGHWALGQVPWLSRAPPRILPVGNKKPRAPGCRAVGAVLGVRGSCLTQDRAEPSVGTGGAGGLRKEELSRLEGQPLSSHGHVCLPRQSRHSRGRAATQAHGVSARLWVGSISQLGAPRREREVCSPSQASQGLTHQESPHPFLRRYLRSKAPPSGLRTLGAEEGTDWVCVGQAATLTGHASVVGPSTCPPLPPELAGPQRLRTDSPISSPRQEEAGTLATGPVSTPPLGLLHTRISSPQAPCGLGRFALDSP